VATPISVASYVLNAPSVSVPFSSLIGMSWLIVPATSGPSFGTPSQPVVTLQRAADGTTETWTWYQLALASNPTGRKTATLLLQDSSGNTLMSYVLENAWPSGIEVTGLGAGAAQAVTETWTFVCAAITAEPG
jgi:phage tail-like protein